MPQCLAVAVDPTVIYCLTLCHCVCPMRHLTFCHGSGGVARRGWRRVGVVDGVGGAPPPTCLIRQVRPLALLGRCARRLLERADHLPYMATACLIRQVRSRDTVALYGSCLIRQVRSLAVSVEALLKSMGGHVASACELHPPAAHPTPEPRQSGGGAPRYDNVGLAQARGHNLSSVDSSS